MDSDEDLVSRAKRGDRAAFDALYKKHIGTITRYCARLLRNAHEGEDAAQKTFLLAWKNLAGFRCAAKFETWLKTIATNVCLKLLRTRKGQDPMHHQSMDDPATSAAAEEQPSEPGKEDPGADEVVSHLFAQQLVRRILECAQTARPRWDALDLNIFELHYIRGVESKREVAIRLGENEGKIKYRIRYHIEPVFKKVCDEYGDE